MTVTTPTCITDHSADRLAHLGEFLGGCTQFPAATSFPELEDVPEPAPPTDWRTLAMLMGAPDAWQSGTSFPELD